LNARPLKVGLDTCPAGGKSQFYQKINNRKAGLGALLCFRLPSGRLVAEK